MATDPRSALTTLVTALERHLEACASRADDEDPRYDDAYDGDQDSYDYDDDSEVEVDLEEVEDDRA